MYMDFFHFSRPPFQNTADPSFFYSSEIHREALATLLYGIQGRKGLVVLVGPVGSGKTILLKKLVAERPQDRCIVLTNPWFTPDQLIDFLLDQLGAPEGRGDPFARLQTIAEENCTDDHRIALIIDEAHLLSEPTMEAVRLLLNLENAQGKLIQLVLSGQEELLKILERYRMRPLRQRVALIEHLSPFDLDDTLGYIQHRLRMAGGDPYLFPRHCVDRIHTESKGLPRLLNQICDNALIFAFGRQSRQIELQDIESALAKLPPAFEEEHPSLTGSTPPPAQNIPEPPPAPPPAPKPSVTQKIPLDTTAGTAPFSPFFASPSSGSPLSSPDTPLSSQNADAMPFQNRPPETTVKRQPPTLVVVIAVGVLAMTIGAGAAWWWFQRPATPAEHLSSPPYTAQPARGIPGKNSDQPQSLPLPMGQEVFTVPVRDTSSLIEKITQHFGADNTSVRDLVSSINPGLDLENPPANTQLRLPRLRRDDLVVADARGRFYLYYGSLADQNLAQIARQDLSASPYPVLTLTGAIANREVYRVYLGPFENMQDARAAANMIWLYLPSYLPNLQGGKQ